MRDYFDADLPWQEYKALHQALTKDAARFDAREARIKAIKTEAFDKHRLCRYALRPFETRWCYYTPVRPIWNEPRPTLWAQMWSGNRFLMARPSGVADSEGPPLSLTSCLGDNDYQRGHSYYLPIQLLNGKRLSDEDHETLFDLLGSRPSKRVATANLSKAARTYLADIGVADPDANPQTAGHIWMHALAIGYSPAYLTENADGIRRDWPRIPLPLTRELLESSARAR